MEEKEIPYILIARFLHGEAILSEIEELERWRNFRPEHEALFAELHREWEASHPQQVPLLAPDKEKVWKKITGQIGLRPRHSYSRPQLFRTAAIAAGLALLLSLGTVIALRQWDGSFFYKSPDNTRAAVFTAPPGSKSMLTLPDGTEVRLNSGSLMAYTEDFNRKNRHVRLEGEAFFKVSKNPGKEFVVATDLVNVRVLGTEFNVSAYGDDDYASVSLVEGKVELELASGNRHLAELLPGEVATVNRRNGRCSIALADPDADNAWLQNKLVIREASFDELYKKLERWYGVNIRVESRGVSYKYWMTIRTESLAEILQLINKSTPIEYTINGEEVVIRYKK